MKNFFAVASFAALSLFGGIVFSYSASAEEAGKMLYMAVQGQDVPALQDLLSHGAKPDYRENGRPLLGWAAQNGNVEVVNALLKAGANPNEFDDNPGHTPLMRAIDMQQTAVVGALLTAKADPNAKSKEGKSCLLMAVETGKPELVQALIDAGADATAVSADGSSPALAAAQEGSNSGIEIIKLLGKAHANLNASNDVYTPLMYAIEQSSTELVQALLDAGADPNAPNKDGKLPIQAASDNAAILSTLLKAKADPNKQLSDGSTLLIAAIKDSNSSLVKTLVDGGANVNRANADGTLPLQIAEDSSNSEMVALLQEKGAVKTLNDYNKPPPVVPIQAYASGSTNCTIVDAAKKLMEVHGLLQAQVNAGKMDSDIFRTYNDDTKDFGNLEVQNPAEACKLLDRLRAKYGV